MILCSYSPILIFGLGDDLDPAFVPGSEELVRQPVVEIEALGQGFVSVPGDGDSLVFKWRSFLSGQASFFRVRSLIIVPEASRT